MIRVLLLVELRHLIVVQIESLVIELSLQRSLVVVEVELGHLIVVQMEHLGCCWAIWFNCGGTNCWGAGWNGKPACGLPPYPLNIGPP
jgi:hypothetical protein